MFLRDLMVCFLLLLLRCTIYDMQMLMDCCWCHAWLLQTASPSKHLHQSTTSTVKSQLRPHQPTKLSSMPETHQQRSLLLISTSCSAHDAISEVAGAVDTVDTTSSPLNSAIIAGTSKTFYSWCKARCEARISLESVEYRWLTSPLYHCHVKRNRNEKSDRRDQRS